jgi:glycine/D-amino acid oxidase-like deaminating enzyme
MNYPITIVGGGLAGLSLSIALRRRGLEVELHEKRRYPFHRVCGEFISGVSREVLDDLGILGCLDGAVAITTMRWYLQDRLALEERLPRKALGLSRYTLDERLANHAGELGVRVQEGSGFRGQDEEGVVWASGKRLDQSSPWIGLSAHVENVEIDGLEMHCGPGGYLGISPVEAGRVNVTGLFRQSRSVKGRGVDLVFGYLEATGCLGLSRQIAGRHAGS